MKKILKTLLVVVLFFTLLPFFHIIHEHEDHDHDFEGILHVHHVYALSPGDEVGDCTIPGCAGGKKIAVDVFNATCTTDGRYLTQCSSCGNMENHTIPALGHNYGGWTTTVAATCTAGGSQSRSCTRCSDTQTQATNPLGHAPSNSVTVQPTCTNTGTQVSRCTRCNTNLGSSSIPALGHNFVTSVTKAATCLQTGIELTSCTRCNESSEKTIPALGHSYRTVITKAATCEETGTQTSTCTRCNHKYNTNIKALGHNWIEEEVEPTCLEDGYKDKKCTRCNKEEKEVLKALGHDLSEETIVKEATCEQDGLKTSVCKRCEETIETKIPKLGHLYLEEWTIEKQAGFFSEGLETKACEHCHEKIEQVIPEKNKTPLVIGGTSSLAAIGGLAYFLMKKKAVTGLVKTAADALDKPEFIKPSIEDKSVVLCSDNQKVIDILKGQHKLEVTTVEYEEFKDSAIENEPDIAICSINDEERLNEILQLKKEDLSEINLGLIISDELIKDHLEELNNLVKDKTLINYVAESENTYNILVRLILPILKPDFKSDETLENIGAIADVLGIPGISTVINVFISGRDIKSTLEEGELGVPEKATIISDIASILGFDTVASVVGLVNDVEDIKSALNKEAGANELKGGVDAGKDIIEVVSDIIDKD